VTDHHEPSADDPDPVPVVNPKLGKGHGAKVLAGVGVAFKVGHALIKRGLEQGLEAVASVDMRDWLDLVAVGTVTDVVPLTGENRILVAQGLTRITRSVSEGLKALLRASRLEGEISPYHLAFVLGPRLNAAGRCGHAGVALDLLLAANRLEAERLALDLERINTRRKRIEERISEEAGAEIAERFEARRDFGLVAGRPGWHAGVIGIVAARLSGRYRRPVVIVGFDENGQGRGSCRSLDKLDILSALRKCADLLVNYGGHAVAAGLVIEQKNLAAFRERFNEACRELLAGQDLCPVENVDAWLENPREADERLLETCQKFAPFGNGNTAPLWGLQGVEVVGAPKVVGGEHVRMTLGGHGTILNAIAFGMAARGLPKGRLDVLFHLQEDRFGGRRSLQLKVRDFRAAGERG